MRTIKDLIHDLRAGVAQPGLSPEEEARAADAMELALAVPRLAASLHRCREHLAAEVSRGEQVYGPGSAYLLADVNNALAGVADAPEILGVPDAT